jgi:D-alanyl-D-alanine carboxypeptidase
MKYCINLSLFFLTVVQCLAINTVKLDSLFDTLEENNKAMGSFSVSKNGKTIYTKEIGFLNFEEKKKTDEQTKFRIGSVTKMFTATLILQLIEEKKLALDTKLEKYFPDFPNANKITIEHLLNHRSGIFNLTNDTNFISWMLFPKTEVEILSIMSSYKSVFEPGSKYQYSNSNYILLGYIIERIEARPYATVLKEKIAGKIGLKNTMYGGKIDPKKNEAFSYYIDKGSWQRDGESDMSIPHGAGAVISTPSDLTKFIEALFDGKLISDSSLARMKNIKEGYGYGMLSFPFFDKKTFGHDGLIDGFNSVLIHFPADSVTFCYLSNGEVFPVNEIMIAAMEIYFDMNYKIPSFQKINLKPEELDKYLGKYSNSDLDMTITIMKKESNLIAQGEGQSPFTLTATGKHTFTFDEEGIEIQFEPANNDLILRQGGGKYTFYKLK